ncbi:EAL domain-containing protein [Devosia psychrophila]|uniref:PAS domain S-box-containing protein/diguanylate cyclase (GGDEF) domain-containing protein n=1 Tax=Devosia psychrophila TaxID=728005 RepID=A0A1I1RFZ5_9HYPH|nr:EAL domain-containing protein [Devosia psychrophila]SFD33112.1 PAS domain S-box-containing protein/diguanylate cyclase (GGDEF) domain-containing protein [Devosia psychrophila]
MLPLQDFVSAAQDQVWKHALGRARLGVWDWNLQTGDCVYSDSWFEMLGYRPGELKQDSDLWLRISHPDDRDRAVASGDRHIAGETDAIETELRLKHKDGHWVWVLDRGGVIERDANGKPLRVVGVQTDISSLKEAENRLSQVNGRYDLVLEASATGIWHFDLASGQSHWDDRTRNMFGLQPNPIELEKNAWHSFLHPDDKERAERAHELKPVAGQTSKIRYRIILKDGQVRHVETLAVYVPDIQNSGSIVGTIRDVTDEVLAAETIKTEKEKLRVTLRSISDAVVSVDIGGSIIFANSAAAMLVGKLEAELTGSALRDSFIVGTDVSLASILGASGQTETTALAEIGEGALFLQWTSNVIRAANGVCLGTVFTLRDVTEAQVRQRELSHAARHDPLTGLLNRNAFDADLGEYILRASTEPIAVYYVDLDYFKGLNDFAGHAAGDAALRAISHALRRSLPEQATIARLGGDEFAVVFGARETEDAVVIATQILDTVRNVDIWTPAGYRRLGASIGVALIHDNQILPSDALAFADDACYRAKSLGRNQFAFFSVAGVTLSSGFTAARIVADIAEAKTDGRLQLYGQEIRTLSDPWNPSGDIEVLARLFAKDGRLISPDEFIPAAERFGMAALLDRWIIGTALRQFGHDMQRTGRISLAFNLSAQTLSDPALWDVIAATLVDTGVAPSNVVFEITETAAFTNFEAAERFVRSARASGCRVSLDDFGTGLSSFEYLRRFPVDCIKIDGAFIQNLATQQFDREIVGAISKIADNLGCDVVAEKIESAEVIDILCGMGIKFGQGFLMHQPEPLNQLIGRLRDSWLLPSTAISSV